MKVEKNYINNSFVESTNNQTIFVYSPVSEKKIAEVPSSTEKEVADCVEIATNAQILWRSLTTVERASYLHKLAETLIIESKSIGEVLAKESGKSLEDATNEAIYAADITTFHAQWARRIEGEIMPSDSHDENLLLFREPLGVIACMIPFNYPVYTLLRKIAPALITGNTVVVRPSNHTPCCAFTIAKAVQKANFPKGVINIMTMNHDSAQVLCTHRKTAMITLTGSVNSGRKMLEYSQQNIIKTSLELGGKTPAIVTADADLSKAAQEIVASTTTNCGQLCTAVERLYVEQSIEQEFIELLLEQMKKIELGCRSENPHFMGPLISQDARDKVHSMVERAILQGAKLLCGGYIPEMKGYFYPPTLLVNCQQNMSIIQEEIFGPVLPVLSFSHIDEAIKLANDSYFGLASLIYTENYKNAMKVANNIEAGECYINRTPADPYQGYHSGWKQSGLGGDDGKHGMLEFTQTRLVVAKY